MIYTKSFQILLSSLSWVFSASRLEPVHFSEVDHICCCLRLPFRWEVYVEYGIHHNRSK